MNFSWLRDPHKMEMKGPKWIFGECCATPWRRRPHSLCLKFQSWVALRRPLGMAWPGRLGRAVWGGPQRRCSCFRGAHPTRFTRWWYFHKLHPSLQNVFLLVKTGFVNNYFRNSFLFSGLNIPNGHVGLWGAYLTSEDKELIVWFPFPFRSYYICSESIHQQKHLSLRSYLARGCHL